MFLMKKLTLVLTYDNIYHRVVKPVGIIIRESNFQCLKYLSQQTIFILKFLASFFFIMEVHETPFQNFVWK